MLSADEGLANRSLKDKTNVMKQIPAILAWFVVSLTLLGGETSPRDYRGDVAIGPSPDGNYYLEAEEFQPASKNDSGWQAKTWGQNYYSATFANSFLSRQAFLGAPAQTDGATSTLQVGVTEAGKHLVLVRYEAAYRFATEFRVRIEQNGKKVFDRLYGARKNLKIWAFSQKLKAEHKWSWGATENMVWEGHDALVNLKPGRATITLVAGKQPEPAAKRNLDLILLTRDVEEVAKRIEKEKYLPLDGLLTQQGDVFLRVKNLGKETVTLTAKNGTEHSPYWVHMRSWKPLKLEVDPGGTTDWQEVGHLLDTMNDGQWALRFKPAGKVNVEVAAADARGKRSVIGKFETTGEVLNLAYFGDTRYSRRIREERDVLFDLLAYLGKLPKHGRLPTQCITYAHTFRKGLDPEYDRAADRFQKLFGITHSNNDSGRGSRVNGYTDVRSIPTQKLEEHCKTKLADRAAKMATVSLGDEIRLPRPSGTEATEGFHAYAKGKKLKPADLVPGAKNWETIAYDVSAEAKANRPGLFYWSRRYLHHHGILKIKERTDILRKYLPNAGIGANYSPHYPAEHRYLGEVHKWVNVFRAEGMTQPWSEDYIFQMPVASMQVNNLNLDLLRAGVRGKPNQKIHYYCMAHWPSNRPESWRRLFYGALGHGMQIVNLFEFRPVQAAYTENHVTHDETYAMVLRSFRELGLFEDVVWDGRPRPANAGLWFSETGDVWGDSHGSFAAGKRSLYLAIRHAQIPLDFIVEADALDGTLRQYEVLYLADKHVSRSASAKIASWVKAGGHLFTTAGAGTFDEYNRPNEILRPLLGIDLLGIDEPEGAQVEMVRQDMAFTKPIAETTWDGIKLPIIGVQAKLKPKGGEVLATFADGSPAIVRSTPGKGETLTCAFLPGLSYYHGSVPKIPTDRSSAADSLSHFHPTDLQTAARDLVAHPARDLTRPATCSETLVEPCIVETKTAAVLTLANWSKDPVKDLEVKLTGKFPAKKIIRASGKALKVEKQKDGILLTLDLEVADAIILR
jgi:hypothetical protein